MNKATGYGESYSPSVPSDDCNQISVTGVFRAANTTQNTFSESAGINAQGEIIYHACWDNRAAFQLSNTGGRIGFRRKNGGAWGPWKQLATTEPPQKYDLPISISLARNWGCQYWKNQQGEVTLSIMLEASQNFTSWETFAVLPVGFRPMVLKDYPAVFFSPHAAGVVRIEPNGAMKVGTAVTNQNYLYLNATFLTA